MSIFLIAFLLRMPFFWYPDSVVIYEGIYATYISNIAHDRPYFELHPPLPNIVMASIAKGFVFEYHILRGTGTAFGEFPYVPLRFINVFLGSFLPVAVFMAAKSLWGRRSYAVIAGLGIAFDNALISYSRTLLPDTMLVVCGMVGIALFLWHEKRKNSLLLVLASIFFGAAFATKWTGLAFFGVVTGTLLLQKKFKEIIILSVGVMLVYGATFFIFFSQFSGGYLTDRFSFDAVPALKYPEPWHIGEAIAFLPRYSELMYRANYSVDRHPSASKPWAWPLGQGSVGMWDKDGKSIVLDANIFGWGAVFASVLFAGILFFYQRLPAPACFALAGYLISFVPFFFIARPFFMYHYFMALVFGWLLVPWAGEEIQKIIAPQMHLKKFLLIGGFCLLFGFLLASRRTYGI